MNIKEFIGIYFPKFPRKKINNCCNKIFGTIISNIFVDEFIFLYREYEYLRELPSISCISDESLYDKMVIVDGRYIWIEDIPIEYRIIENFRGDKIIWKNTEIILNIIDNKIGRTLIEEKIDRLLEIMGWDKGSVKLYMIMKYINMK